MTAAGRDVRVLIVDDQELVRAGLALILRKEHGTVVVGECCDGDEVLDAVDRCDPDVIVMDLRMPRIGGVEVTRLLTARNGPPVLALTTFDDDDLVSGALRAGAAGFILKDSSAEELIRAVHLIDAGNSYLDPAVTAKVLATYRKAAEPAPRSPALDSLTPREYEVLLLVAAGHNNAEIAGLLQISEFTVKTHIGRIFSKMDLRDRAAAIRYAYQHRLLPDSSG